MNNSVTTLYGTVRAVTALCVRYGMIRYGTLRYGNIRYGTVRYGTVLNGTVLNGTVRYDTGGNCLCSTARAVTALDSRCETGVH